MKYSDKPPVTLRYTLPNIKWEGWAIVLLTSDGVFTAVSDWGNYAFVWSSFGGRDFREFLLSAEKDTDYFIKKLQHGGDGPGDVYDGEGTARSLRQLICRLRRSRDLSAVQAREDWDLIDHREVEDSDYHFWRFLEDTSLDTSDLHEFIHYKRNPQAKAFVEKILVGRLCPIFREELELEKSQTLTIDPSVVKV